MSPFEVMAFFSDALSNHEPHNRSSRQKARRNNPISCLILSFGEKIFRGHVDEREIGVVGFLGQFFYNECGEGPGECSLPDSPGG